MANMGYVRFENTLSDLEDCHEHLDDRLSESESESRKQLVELCQSIAADAKRGAINFDNEED